MEFTKKITNDIYVKFESENEIGAFKTLARLNEVFGHVKCGVCQSDAEFVCRVDGDANDWLEMVCQNKKCNAKLVFGSVKGKEGLIFPKTRVNNLSPTQQEQRSKDVAYANEHSGWLPNGGWFVYKKDN